MALSTFTSPALSVSPTLAAEKRPSSGAAAHFCRRPLQVLHGRRRRGRRGTTAHLHRPLAVWRGRPGRRCPRRCGAVCTGTSVAARARVTRDAAAVLRGRQGRGWAVAPDVNAHRPGMAPKVGVRRGRSQAVAGVVRTLLWVRARSEGGRRRISELPCPVLCFLGRSCF